MAITHEASSGVEASTTAKGTTSTTVAYVGVAAGRLAVLIATAKTDTATFGTVSGWTQLLDVAGGAAEALASDAGPTRLGVWHRTLDGSETGNVTITATGSDCLVGGMSVYSVTAGWDPLVYVTGSDSTHATTFSATAGAWSESLAVGDLLVIARSSDNDGIGAKSAFTLTQTGATFGTIEYRNNRLNSSAADCCVASWDTTVTAGSANAPTFGHAQTAMNCGALAVVRIRESAGTVTGSMATTLPALATAAIGTVSVPGAIAPVLPALTAASSGEVSISGAADVALPALTDVELVGILSASSGLAATLPALTAAFRGPSAGIARPTADSITRPTGTAVSRPSATAVTRPTL